MLRCSFTTQFTRMLPDNIVFAAIPSHNIRA
jgi:hypothetical protein